MRHEEGFDTLSGQRGSGIGDIKPLPVKMDVYAGLTVPLAGVVALWILLFQDGIGTVLHQFQDLPVPVTTGGDRLLNPGMFPDILGHAPVVLDAVPAPFFDHFFQCPCGDLSLNSSVIRREQVPGCA